MNHNIKHIPIFNIENIIEIYSEKDGVPIKYVCTTSFSGDDCGDIFYRESPHPEFGNKYFGIKENPFTNKIYIYNADKVEDLVFSMIKYMDSYYYSRYRHDCVPIKNTSNFIDGGRDYCRIGGDLKDCHIATFKIKDGEFVLEN